MFAFTTFAARLVPLLLAGALLLPQMGAQEQQPLYPTGPYTRMSLASSIHWYSRGGEPQGISDTFNVLVRLLPDYRKLHQEHISHPEPWKVLTQLPMRVRVLLSAEDEPDHIDFDDELVKMTSEIIAELKAPGSNREAALLIACSTGDIDTVTRISQEYEKEQKALPLHRMIVVAMDNSQATITHFCLHRGAVVGDNETRYAAWLGRSAELFEVLFPYNIFRLDQEPQYIHQLLKDALTLDHGINLGGRPLEKARLWDTKALAKYLVGQGAEVEEDMINKAADHISVSGLAFLLSHFHGSLNEVVLKDVLRSQTPKAPDHYERFSLLVARIPAGQISAPTVRNAIFDGPQYVDLLLAHGATLTGSYALHEAAIFGAATMIPYLLDHGLPIHEKVDKPLDMEDWAHRPIIQWYALHYAVAHRRPRAVRALLERGADPWLENSIGQTAFEVGVAETLTGVSAREQSREQKEKDESNTVLWHGELVQVHAALMDHCGLSDGDPRRQELKERFETVEDSYLQRQRERIAENNYA